MEISGSDVERSSVVDERDSFFFKSVALLSAVMLELSRLCSANSRDTFCFCLRVCWEKEEGMKGDEWNGIEEGEDVG